MKITRREIIVIYVLTEKVYFMHPEVKYVFFGPRSCATRPNKTFLPEEAFATRAKKFYLAEERSDEAQKNT